jgi:hypothetical protein
MGRAGIEPATLGLKVLHDEMNTIAPSIYIAQPWGFSPAVAAAKRMDRTRARTRIGTRTSAGAPTATAGRLDFDHLARC